MTPPARVIKLGGSLLDWPELAPSFRDWLARQLPAANIVVVGGGSLVEALRELDRRHRLDPEAMHWLCIRAMGLTARLLAQLLPEAVLATRPEQLQLSLVATPQVFDVEQFLREDAGAPESLPCGWEVTSDSIAARVARVLGASELVLLKSTLPAIGSTPDEWSRSGLVDEHFHQAARGLNVHCVDLRHGVSSRVR